MGAYYQFCLPVHKHGKSFHLFKSVKYSIQHHLVQIVVSFVICTLAYLLLLDAVFKWSYFLHFACIIQSFSFSGESRTQLLHRSSVGGF